MTGKFAYLPITVFILLLAAVSSCKKDVPLEENNPGPHAVKLQVPGNFPAAKQEPDNPLTAEGIELGRMLFYDVRLSGNNRISCASCHRQDLAFTDGVALSTIGVSGKKLDRHAPSLFNLAWAKTGLFWDGGSKNLESQAFGPLTIADEMHQDLLVLEAELKQIPDYVSRFKQAFNEDIKSTNVVKALAQFQRTLISGTSRYDKYKRSEAGASLTTIELQGMNLVNSKCKSCHSGELFTDDGYHNNGIDATFSDDHEGIFQGRFRVSFDPNDIGKFKTPSLRNVIITPPYMHDGRFKTIEEVLDHYQSGIKISPTIDQLLYQNQGQAGIPLSKTEREAIIAFLDTLTDYEFINNKKISNPNE
ncbi:cytochrome C peroxidase [Pedobacter antarcticus 4BY]|uniref:Cytochrome C peroxidase n=2 Tax=Pedobacter antarcticus TaxID=34086 RepID=A0A081PC42_9SPHI|nr:cytochrome c peroxidase [Pedobacter antarcticus]KEQ28265.1 cytochrome C peroxidase [Pedobacter antarcticus 4BY]SFE47083.1 cytochrome c peroxidase [Pedobacter antarcticus]